MMRYLSLSSCKLLESKAGGGGKGGGGGGGGGGGRNEVSFVWVDFWQKSHVILMSLNSSTIRHFHRSQNYDLALFAVGTVDKSAANIQPWAGRRDVRIYVSLGARPPIRRQEGRGTINAWLPNPSSSSSLGLLTRNGTRYERNINRMIARCTSAVCLSQWCTHAIIGLKCHFTSSSYLLSN